MLSSWKECFQRRPRRWVSLDIAAADGGSSEKRNRRLATPVLVV
jgi:hypothetical protein